MKMEAALSDPPNAPGREQLLAATVARERGRLLGFIRRRIADAAEAEDILQEAFYELVLAWRALVPIEDAGAWLVRVARNRIIDRFRRRRRERPVEGSSAGRAEAEEVLEDLLPSADEGPEGEVMREMLLAEIGSALKELPSEQREVFLAHELDGVSFSELSARTGVSVNTLLSRKHYAVRFLRQRLKAAWNDWLME